MITKIKAIKNITIFLSCLVVSVACTIPCWALQADINYDSEVNFLDLAILANEWLKTGQQEIPPTKGSASFVVAASDAPTFVKQLADYVCDGTDDQVEIQAAIDALPAYSQGGSVVLSQGNFNIGASITVRGACRLAGQGVYATRVNLAANVDMFSYSGGSVQGFFYMEGMFLDGKRASYTGRGLVCNANLWDVYLNRVFFGYFGSDAIYTQQAWGWVINQTVIEWCKGNGLVLDGHGSGPKLMDCKFMENEKNAVLIKDSGGLYAINCELSALDIGVNDTTFYVLLDCGKDVGTWYVGDAVRNDVGDGDDWTGTVYEVSYLDNNEHIIVAMTAGKDDTDIDLADGIENTTIIDTTTLDSKTIHRYCGIRVERGSDHTIIGTKFGIRTNGMGIYLKSSARSVISGNKFTSGHTGLSIATSSVYHTVVGNLFYNQSSKAIDDNDGRNVIANNEGYISECMEEISVNGNGVATTITLNHTLAAPSPIAYDRIFTITPLSQKMAEATYWISSITSTQVVITFAAALENGQTYKFHIIGRYQRRDWNLTVP